MKRNIFKFIMFAICGLMLVGCSGNNANTSKDSTESEMSETENDKKESGKDTEIIDFSVDDGNLKYIGVEKASEGLISTNKDIDKDKVVMLKFEYTNKQEDPSQCQNTFYIQVFQNGVEVKKSLSYSSGGGEQYELCGNFFSEALKGGTVTFGKLVLLNDSSPLTIVAKEKGSSDKKQQMELDISSVISSDNNSNGEASAAVDNMNEKSTENEQALSAIALGEMVTTDDFEFTLNKVELSYNVEPENPPSYYTYYAASEGQVYIYVNATVKNLTQQDIRCDNVYSVTANYNNGYKYKGFNIITDSDGDFNYSNINSISPLQTMGIHCLVDCPSEIETSGNPLELTIKLRDGKEYLYTVR